MSVRTLGKENNMGVKTKTDILNSLKEIIGESTEDNALSLIEDVSDTFDDFENKTKDNTDWEKKYKENDEAWKKKYKDRFFSSGDNDDDNDDNKKDDEVVEKPKTYENLFESK